jgi:RNA polymerase sigma-70 factor (ECF subfamily)
MARGRARHERARFAILAAGVRGGISHGMTQDAAARAEELARAAYGRLLAILAAGDGDIESAEDCLADAFAQALHSWPETGVPSNPGAWLLTVARNRRRDLHRSAAHRLSDRLDDVARRGVLSTMQELDPDAIPDRRLALLFVCAHPAIDPTARTPLMLQAVLGFNADQIARAFVIPAATMAQRLVRAKRRIREARIPFVVPERGQMPERLTPVLEAIYGAYAIDFPLVAGTEPRDSLAAESHYLAITLAELLPEEPEALGLAALLSLSLARRPARGTIDELVPLDEQDPSRWDAELIALGERYLQRAHALGRIGRFQIEAAIQSAHCARATSGVTDWRALQTLHAALLSIAPTLGARVAHAAAVGRVEGARAGLEALDAIADDAVQRFQPAWATCAHLLAESGRAEEAVRAYERAISLTTDKGARRYLERRRMQLLGDDRPSSASRENR